MSLILQAIAVVRQDGERFDEAEAVKQSRMTSTTSAIVRTDRSILSVMKVVLNYTSALRLQHFVSFSDARIKNIVDDMMPSQYLPTNSRSSYIRYAWIWPSDGEAQRSGIAT